MAAPKHPKIQLTAKQQVIYDALEADHTLTYAALGTRLKQSQVTVRKSYMRSCEKQRHEPTRRVPKGGEYDAPPALKRHVNRRLGRMAISKRPPEEQAEAMFAAMDPMMRSIKEAATEAGVSSAVMGKFMKLLQGELRSVQSEVTEIRMDKLQKLFGGKLERVVDSINQEDIDNASLKDKAIAAGILTEKWLLLRGQPTQILAIEERRQLDEIAPLIIAEAKRRSIELSRDPISGSYAPQRNEPRIRDAALRKQESSYDDAL